MADKSTVPLLSNIKIDSTEKIELFKVTIADAAKVFDEAHIKIRGALAVEAIEFLKQVGFERLFLYQELQEDDWVSATLEMLYFIEARTVFLYFEDHRLIASFDTFKSVIQDFEVLELDFLCYSFFRASNLDTKNVLPFCKAETDNLVALEFDSSTINYLEKVSPGYYTFSLLAIVSVRYFRDLLHRENAKIKLYSKKGSALASRIFRYPKHKKVFRQLNALLNKINISLCFHHPSSPFNLEKMLVEFYPFSEKFKVGLPKQELYANHDDDNGAYGESLIKRGLYPFDTDLSNIDIDNVKDIKSIERQISLNDGAVFDCTYYSRADRIRQVPMVEINVILGNVVVFYKSKNKDMSFSLSTGDKKLYYSNLGPVIQSVGSSQIQVKIFDESF